MFFIFSKTLFYLVMPLLWITLILLYSLITKNAKRSKRAVILALILVMFFGNDFIINELLKVWERKPIPISSLQKHEYAIVLTGITNTQKKNFDDRVFFNKGADRLLHAVQLYKDGYIKKIIISGGSSSIVEDVKSESPQLKRVFITCGVPENDIIIEDQSRNTYENALFTKKLIDSLNNKEKFLLITSAFHMRRSEACFKKAGVNFNIFPVDICTRDTNFNVNYLIIPSEGALNKWHILIHELLGFTVYKIIGYF